MRDGILTDERGPRALQRLREATADHLADVAFAGAEDDFRHRARVIPFTRALFIDSQISPYSNERTPRHIARGGVDHYLILLCLGGGVTFGSGRRSVTLRPGDLCLMDMAQANRTSVSADAHSGLSHSLALTLPRAVLAPLLASPDASTASLVSRDSMAAKLLAAQYLALCRNDTAGGSGASIIASEDPITSEALAGVIADAVGSAKSAEGEVDRANRQLLLASIKRYIDANLQTETLGVEHLCRRFRLSRATLYRLFEPEGGLSSYVQEQRLNRAFRMLASPATAGTRIIDLALDFNFSSDSAFVRTFRRRFGLTPGEVRRLAGAGMATRRSDRGVPNSVSWLRTLACD